MTSFRILGSALLCLIAPAAALADGNASLMVGGHTYLPECGGTVYSMESSARDGVWIEFERLQHCSKIVLISQQSEYPSQGQLAVSLTRDAAGFSGKLFVKYNGMSPGSKHFRLSVMSNSRKHLDAVTLQLNIPSICTAEPAFVRSTPGIRIVSSQHGSSVGFYDSLIGTLASRRYSGACMTVEHFPCYVRGDSVIRNGRSFQAEYGRQTAYSLLSLFQAAGICNRY